MTHLRLYHVKAFDNCYLASTDGMMNLRELRLNMGEINTDELANFVSTKYQLELFSYFGYANIRPVFDTLAQYCPRLKTFVDFNFIGYPYTLELEQHYNSVERFTNITTIGLTTFTQCGSDLFYPLRAMAAQNKVQEIKICIDHRRAITLDDDERMHYDEQIFGNFTSLQSVVIYNCSESHKEVDLNFEFIREFMAKRMNVEKLRLISASGALRNIDKIIDEAPHIKHFNIVDVNMEKLPIKMRRIVKSIHKRYTPEINGYPPNPERFHISVNFQQWRELNNQKIIHELNNIFTTTIMDRQSFHVDLICP